MLRENTKLFLLNIKIHKINILFMSSSKLNFIKFLTKLSKIIPFFFTSTLKFNLILLNYYHRFIKLVYFIILFN